MSSETPTGKQTRISRIDKGAMKRVLGVKDLFAVGYGDLGSSIYYAIGITAFYALGATPLALIAAGLVFCCTALTYAEMSSIVYESGGSAGFSRKAFNDLISFIAGWALLLDFIVTIAISAFAVAPYLKIFFPSLAGVIPHLSTSVGVIFLLLMLNLVGVSHSTRFSFVLTTIAIVTQFIIIIFGFAFLVNLPDVFEHMKIGVANSAWSPTWGSFWKGVAMAMVAYTGIESMSQLSSEAKNPSRTVPRAIVWAMGTLLVLYLGISVIALSAMTPQVLSTQYVDDPLAGIAKAIPYIGKYFVHWVGLVGAIILIVASNAGLIGASRLSFNLGEYYQLPRSFYRLTKKSKVPFVSLIVFAVSASLIILWSRGRLNFLADLYNFGAMLAFFTAHLSIIMHRIKYKDVHRPFKIPFNMKIRGCEIPITAVLGALATFATWVMVLFEKPEGRNLGILWLLLGIPMYLLYRRRHKMSPTGSLEIQKIKIHEYAALGFKRILVPTRGGVETETVQIACQIAKEQNAIVTAVNVIEIPFAFPLSNNLLQRPKDSDSILQRAEAIAGEYGVQIELKQIFARSVSSTLIEMIEEEKFDLLIMGAPPNSKQHPYHGLGAVTDRVLHEANCRVWVCRGVETVCEVIRKDQTDSNHSETIQEQPDKSAENT